MSEYFEPVSVLSLGQILGLGEIDGDTLRRWFHGLAQGAINFEDDAARWAVSDAIGAEIDRELGPVLERLFESPDSSTIATMLQHAEGTLAERVAGDPADAEGDPARRDAGARARCGLDGGGTARVRARQPPSPPSPTGSFGTRSRRACAGSLRSGPRPVAPRVDVELGGTCSRRARTSVSSSASANRDEEVWGPTAAAYDLRRPKRNHAAFGFGPHFCSGHHFSRVQMRIAVQRLFETASRTCGRDPDRPPVFNGWEFRAPQHLHVRWDP